MNFPYPKEVDFDDDKKWWTSKGIWGGVLAVTAPALTLAGYAISSADQLSLSDSITMIASGIGGLIAIYGRVKASKRIT